MANEPIRLQEQDPHQPPIRLTVLISGNGSNLQALIDATTITTTSSNHDDNHDQPNKDEQHNEDDEYEVNRPPPRGLQNLLTIVRVISNRKLAYGLQRASQAGIPTRYHNILPYRRRHALRQNRVVHDERVPLPSERGVSPERGTHQGAESKGGEEQGGEEQVRRHYDEDLLKIILADDPDLIICAGWMHVLSPTFLAQLDTERKKRRGGGQKIPILNLHPARLGEFDGVDAIARAWRAARALMAADGTGSTGVVDARSESRTTTTDENTQFGSGSHRVDHHHSFQSDHEPVGGKRKQKIIMETAVTVHHLTERVDGGDPVVVETVPIYDTDRSLEEFEERMHCVEWRVIVQAAERIAREILDARRKQ